MSDTLGKLGRCVADVIVEVASSEMSTDDRARIGAALNALQTAERQEAVRQQQPSLARLMEIHRNVSAACVSCQGLGVRVYGSTSTWRGGVGGSTITTDVCDHCWGSGDAHRHWQSWRQLEENAASLIVVINALRALGYHDTLLQPNRLTIDAALRRIKERLDAAP